MPVPLLTFDPTKGNDKRSPAHKLLEEDVWMGLTPDLPVFRFRESIPVFIWDDLYQWNGLKTRGIPDDEYEVTDVEAFTVDKMLPFFQKERSNSSVMRNVLPQSPTWNKSLGENPINVVPRVIRGKIINVSLYGLTLLDVLYNNTISHTRQEARFTVQGEERLAFMYTMPTRCFTKYDPHENSYSLISGFNPAACNTLKSPSCPDKTLGYFSSHFVQA